MFECMRRGRLSYHYAIRKVRKDAESIKSERIAASLFSNSSHNFWDEIKPIRSHSSGVSSTVDGASDSHAISKIFTDKYRKLYTCVSYSVDDMKCIQDEINSNICQVDCPDELFFSALGMRATVGRLKLHKNDIHCRHAGLSSDHFVNARDDYLVHISMLFNAIVEHSSLPDIFLYSTIVPIPKGRNVNLSDSSNYPGIALYGELFDNAVLMYFSCKLKTSDLQFGFKTKHSTSQCTFAVKELLAYYVDNNSSVKCAFFMLQAFDRVNYCKLFRLLIKRKLPVNNTISVTSVMSQRYF